MNNVTDIMGQNRPRYGIGIDTGGTYTDSVIVELNSGTVISMAKALTTPADFSLGIDNSLSQLDRELFCKVGLVALSTTLATNSVVEGNGARVGLVMAVPQPATFQLPTDLPCEQVVVIAGGHNHRGEMTVTLAPDAADRIERLVPEVDAFAVSSYFSIYNPEHELTLRQLVSERTDKPTICAHELSGQVGMLERATTAILNARLLPVIRDLLTAVEKILDQMRIHAPLMIVKGDGSMLSSDACRIRPVETVLSGPAASISGACRLSGVSDALVLDMGGTTTDIALVRGGRAIVSQEGALVGGLRTRVKAVDMWTLGLGGDSHIRLDAAGELQIGPQRVLPFSFAGITWPELVLQLRQPTGDDDGPKPDQQRFFTLRRRTAIQLSPLEQQLLFELDGKVLSLRDISERISSFLDVSSLIKQGLIIEVGFTPTDLLHCTGAYRVWDVGAAEAGLQLLAGRANRSQQEMAETIRRELDLLLARGIIAKALQEDRGIAATWQSGFHSFLDRLLRLDDSHPVSALFPLRMPLVAVGAPVHAHLPSAVGRLGCELIIPPHAEIANAYGAVTGKVIETASSVIRPATPDGYIVISGKFRQQVVRLQEAVQLARQQTERRARDLVADRGGEAIEVNIGQEEIRAPLEAGWGDSILIELRLMATASGSPILSR